MVGGFEFAVGVVRGIGSVVEAAVGQRSTEAFVKEQEEQRDLDAFCGELVSVPRAIPLQQAVPFEFAQVIAELILSRKL